MRSAAIGCLLLFLNGCDRRNSQPVLVTLADPPPELVGEVTDASGNPLTDVDVRVYTGVASYLPLTDVQTDERGGFRVPITAGAMSLNEAERRWDFSVGVRLEMNGLPPPRGGLHWTRLILNKPGHVHRVRFRIEDGGVETSESDAQPRWATPPPPSAFRPPGPAQASSRSTRSAPSKSTPRDGPPRDRKDGAGASPRHERRT